MFIIFHMQGYHNNALISTFLSINVTLVLKNSIKKRKNQKAIHTVVYNKSQIFDFTYLFQS